MKSLLLTFGFFVLLVIAISADEKSDKTKKTIKPAHKGVVLELGNENGFVEYVHDDKKGEITIYILDTEGKSKKIADIPKVVLFGINGNTMPKKNIPASFLEEGQKESDVFIAKDDSLKSKDLNGRIVIKDGENSFQVNFTFDTPEEKLKRKKEEEKQAEELKKKEAEKK